MGTRVAWVLNLDADVELGTTGPYTPTKTVRAAMKANADVLAKSLVGPDDVVVDDDSLAGSARGFVGRAFCPTPRAIAILRRAGAEPDAHPGVEVLRRVNSRAFAASLGETLPGEAFVTDIDVARVMLATAPPVGNAWRVKPAFGMAGRNHRVMRAAPPDESDLAFVAREVARAGAQIEPNVALAEEYGIHGFVDRDGGLRSGTAVRQQCDARGAWVTTERLADAHENRVAVMVGAAARMGEEAARVAEALALAGYWGPFGVDGFAYREREGRLVLRSRSEINARYSMGFAVGMGR